MSATNRGARRIAQDWYPTPGYCIELLLPLIDWAKVRSFLEPCRGAGANYDCVRVPTKASCEIREGRDYLTTEYAERFDLIITNPPFSLAMEFLRKSLDEADTVIYLLRLNMLGSQARRDFWNNRPPTHLFPLAKRPSFTGNATDATEYAWFVWDRGRPDPGGWLADGTVRRTGAVEQHIASIAKSSVDSIEIAFKEYKDANYLDIRTYTEIDGKEGRAPTKKGITIRPTFISELREALEKAETVAREAGLVR